MKKIIKKLLIVILSLFCGFVAFSISAIILTILNLYLSGHGIRMLSTDLGIIQLSLNDIIAIATAVFVIVWIFRLLLRRDKTTNNHPDVESNVERS